MALRATRLAFFDDMWRAESVATVLSHLVEDGGRHAIILDSTIFHPQGGGQPADTGRIALPGDPGFKFLVEDVRSKDNGVVYHYGVFEDAQTEGDLKIEKGVEVHLCVDTHRRNLNSRLHSGGHLLDVCMHNVGLSYLEPGKGYHFPDGPFVEYKGTIPADQLLNKQNELEREANALISIGGKVLVAVVPYEEAYELCGGTLPSYILKGSTPRIVRLGNNPGCPCGGTHVADITDIRSLKVTQIRVKKGCTKVFYTVGS
uniref:Alanyl-tRNA editing protein AlaX-L n=1 Tax=Anthurium amnicola TaxID=1678845 RepID=A0A1D1YHN7_9ARAE